MKYLATTWIAAMAGGLFGLQTCAANEVILGVTGTPYTATNTTFGFAFSEGSQPISVTDLGFYYPGGGTNLNFNHEVGLWDSTGNLLASVTFASGQGFPQPNGFRYETITAGPVYLAAGDTFFLGALYNENDTDTALFQGISSSDPAITYLGSTRAFTLFVLDFPNVSLSPFADDGIFGPNALFTIIEVPEPAAGAVLAVGLTTFAWYRRRRR